MNDLNTIQPMYQFSLKAFRVVFQRAVLRAEPGEALKRRLSNLTDSITSSVFQYTTRGLFECDKLTYCAQLTFQVGEKDVIFCMVGFQNKPSIESGSGVFSRRPREARLPLFFRIVVII
ncbi:hypothetical protein CesoFtcFv8_025671 [Champsocephalus esox]|uniref:Uncharacterized protein n=1 Tax=Champsocephalus esox TaxID=159716 RepID=A0AAN8GBB4_9TELE|nr:hypothetical protein CesoFtcFv8_025671 [Champsocephalus esox]